MKPIRYPSQPSRTAPPKPTVTDPTAWRRWLYTGSSSEIVARLSRLRKTAPFEAQRALAPTLYSSALSKPIVGDLFPSSYTSLQSQQPKLYFATDWLVEVLWNHLVFSSNADAIDRFLDQRRSFHTNFLLGRYDRAEVELKDLIASYGVSLWTLEHEFLLKQYKGGFAANKEMLSEIHSSGCNSYVNYLASLFSLRVEQDVSADYYRKVLKQKVYTVWPDPHDIVREYISSYADPFGEGTIVHKAYCIWKETGGSLFDRYLQTLKIVRNAITTGVSDQDRARLCPIFSDLSARISDPDLEYVRRAIEGEPGPLNKSAHDVRFNEALDAYTTGDYRRAIEGTTNIIREDPSRLECYEVAAKAAVHAQVACPTVGSQPSVANKVCSLLCEVFSDETVTNGPEEALASIAQQLGDRKFSLALEILLRRNAGMPSAFLESAARLRASLDNPEAYIEGQDDKVDERIADFKQQYVSSVTAEFISLRTRGSITASVNTYGIDPLRWELGAIEELIETGESAAAVSRLNSILADRSRLAEIPNCVVSRCISLQIEAFGEMGNVKAGLEVFASHYLYKKQLVRRVPVSELLDEVSPGATTAITGSLEYLLARAVVGTTRQDVYEAVDDFLFVNGCLRPRDVFTIASKFDLKLLAFVVTYVMRRDVLSRGDYCATSAELDDERLFLLNAVGSLTQDGYAADLGADVRAEISSLNKDIILRAASQHVNAGRVSINFEAIRVRCEAYRPLFTRYQALRAAERNADISLIPLSSINLDPAAASSSAAAAPLERIQESLQVFREIYILLLFGDCLLDEAVGLDATLSARIRHGALSNMMRSPFEEGSLITRKNVTRDFYLPSEPWETFLRNSGVAEQSIEAFNTSLTRFTANVDNLVAHLQRNVLQVKVPRIHALDVAVPQYTSKPEGMFDYTELWFAADDAEEKIGRGSVSTEELVEQLLAIFVDRTNHLLAAIRKHIKGAVHKQLRNAVDLFLSDVRSIDLPAKALNKFQDEVLKSRTLLQNMIKGLSEWFRFKGPQTFPNFSFDVAVEAVLKAINNSSGGRLQDTRTTLPSIVLRGEHFHSVYDILFTVLYNVVEHSDLPSQETGLVIEGAAADGQFSLKVSNAVNFAKEVQGCVDAANELITDGSRCGERRAVSEGRSGFLKIRKILERDLARKKMQMDAEDAGNNRFQLRLAFELEGLVAQA